MSNMQSPCSSVENLLKRIFDQGTHACFSIQIKRRVISLHTCSKLSVNISNDLDQSCMQTHVFDILKENIETPA